MYCHNVLNSYSALPLSTTRTVISTRRSAWRDLSTVLEMTICRLLKAAAKSAFPRLKSNTGPLPAA